MILDCDTEAVNSGASSIFTHKGTEPILKSSEPLWEACLICQAMSGMP